MYDEIIELKKVGFPPRPLRLLTRGGGPGSAQMGRRHLCRGVSVGRAGVAG